MKRTTSIFFPLIAFVAFGLQSCSGNEGSSLATAAPSPGDRAVGISIGEAFTRPGMQGSSLGVVLSGAPASDLYKWIEQSGAHVESFEWGTVVFNQHIRCSHNPSRATPYECGFSVMKDGSVVEGM